MQARLDYMTLVPATTKKMLEWSQEIKRGAIPEQILNLVFLRASQLNGCAY